MTQNFTNAAPASGDTGNGGMTVAKGFQGKEQRKGVRGLCAVGFLILSAVMCYGIVFVLIDKWYKGGSLGIL